MSILISIAFFYNDNWLFFLMFLVVFNFVSVDVNHCFSWLSGIAPTRSRPSFTSLNYGFAFEQRCIKLCDACTHRIGVLVPIAFGYKRPRDPSGRAELHKRKRGAPSASASPRSPLVRAPRKADLFEIAKVTGNKRIKVVDYEKLPERT